MASFLDAARGAPLKLKAVIQFPAQIVGDGNIVVTRQNGIFTVSLNGTALPAAGTVRVLPIQGSLPNTPGNLRAYNAYGLVIGDTSMLPAAMIQNAISVALPSTGNIFTQSNARDFEMSGGYIGLAAITWPGYQNVKARIGGVSFLDVTQRSAEMCDFEYAGAQVDSWTFAPTDQGAPGGDDLHQIVDSRFFATTVFKVVEDITNSGITCSTMEIIEHNVSSNTITNGWFVRSPRSGENYGFNRRKTTHSHSDGGNLDTYFKIGDQAPANTQTFGYNSWDIQIDNTARNGSQDGFVTYESKSFIDMKSKGFTNGNELWFRSGAQDNVVVMQTDRASPTWQDSNGAASTNLVTVGGFGMYFGGKRYAPLDAVSTHGIAYVEDHPNGRGRVINSTSSPTDGQLIVGQTNSTPALRNVSGDATLAASGALTIANNAVSYAKMQNISATGGGIILGRVNTGSGPIAEFSISQFLDALGATVGAVLYRSNGGGWAILAPGTSGLPLVSNGAGTGPSYAQVSLTSAVSGVLPSANGGASPAGQLPATATNDNAAAGKVGEFVEATLAAGSAVSLTTNTSANVTSISLTAGDWDVEGNIVFAPAATTTVTIVRAGTGTTSATLPAADTNYSSVPFNSAAINSNPRLPTTRMRVSIASTTTVYLVAQATFGTSTMTAYGYISARRMR